MDMSEFSADRLMAALSSVAASPKSAGASANVLSSKAVSSPPQAVSNARATVSSTPSQTLKGRPGDLEPVWLASFTGVPPDYGGRYL